MFARVYLCLHIHMFTRFVVFTYVYTCLPMFTSVYSSLPMLTRVYVLTMFTRFYICDPILENQPYRGIIDFEIWPCKVTTGVLGQK